MRHAGELVTKEALLEAVWPNTIVTDGVLKRHVRELRAILNDDSEEPQYIETIPRRGYRWIAPLAPTTQSDVSPQLSVASQNIVRRERLELRTGNRQPTT